jgi:hypothetical protein
MLDEFVVVAADELVDAPPGAEPAAHTHAAPIAYAALLTSADFVIDDKIAHDADGNRFLLSVDGGEDATGTVTPEALVRNTGMEKEKEEERG